MVAQPDRQPDDNGLVVIDGGAVSAPKSGSASATYIEPGRTQHTHSVPPEVEGDTIYASVLEPRASGGRPYANRKHPLDAYFNEE